MIHVGLNRSGLKKTVKEGRPLAWPKVLLWPCYSARKSRVVKFCGKLTCRAWFDFTETDPVGLAAPFSCVYREFIKFYYDCQETNKCFKKVTRFKYLEQRKRQ